MGRENAHGQPFERYFEEFWERVMKPAWLREAPHWLRWAPVWMQTPPKWTKQAPAWIQQAPTWSRQAPRWITEAPSWLQQAPAWTKQAPTWLQQAPPAWLQHPPECANRPHTGTSWSVYIAIASLSFICGMIAAGYLFGATFNLDFRRRRFTIPLPFSLTITYDPPPARATEARPPAVYEDIYRRREPRIAARNRAWRHRRFSETETEDGGIFTPGGSSGTVEVLTPTASSTGVEDN